jgi:O-antigen ligase
MPQKMVFGVATLVLLLSTLFGGGQGFFGDVLAQLAAIGLLIACAFNQDSELMGASRREKIFAFSFIAVVLFVPLLQLYPWPATNAVALALKQDMLQAGLQVGSVSLNKTYGAERALFSLLPACAIFIAALQLPNHYRYRLLAVLAVIVLLNIFLGFAQLAQGKESALRLYAVTNATQAVGFFANRNHFASLLMMCLPMVLAATAWCFYQRDQFRQHRSALVIAGIFFSVLMILAIAVSRSRAGLLLAMVGILFSILAIFALPQRQGMKRLLGAVLLLGVIATIQFGFFGISQRFEQGVVDKTRAQMTRVSIEAGKAYAPMGSGLGTFRQAYVPFEVKDAAGLDSTLTNHAHNDYAELWLEAGYPALAAMMVFWLLFLALGVRVWLLQKSAHTAWSRLLSKVAWAGAALSLLHSFVDYPLRTTANTAVLAVLLGLALAATLTGRKNAGHGDRNR